MSASPPNSRSPSPPNLDLFEEPAGYRPSTPPTQTITVPYDFTGSSSSMSLSTTTDAQASPISSNPSESLTIQLVGSHPLWGHHIWNASLDMSRYLQAHSATLLKGKSVLELGAAAGIPSIVAAREGAEVVIASDYPDQELIEVLRSNLERNVRPATPQSSKNARASPHLVAQGFLWGTDIDPIRAHLPLPEQGFDVLLLSDLIFNHQAHVALLTTMDAALSHQPAALTVAPRDAHPSRLEDDANHPDFPDRLPLGEFSTTASESPCILVFFTSHRPHLADKDMDFFRKAEATGKWQVERVGRWRREPMFPTDPGSAIVRGTVHGFRIIRT